jgi:hypothetical protein
MSTKPMGPLFCGFLRENLDFAMSLRLGFGNRDSQNAVLQCRLNIVLVNRTGFRSDALCGRDGQAVVVTPLNVDVGLVNPRELTLKLVSLFGLLSVEMRSEGAPICHRC